MDSAPRAALDSERHRRCDAGRALSAGTTTTTRPATRAAPLRITTSRLELRDYAPQDLSAFVAYQADPRAREFYGPGEATPEQLAELLRTFVSWSLEQPRRNWQLAIALRDAPGVVVGSCGLRGAGLKAGHADLGIELSPELWGRGYGTEATRAMLDFGFATLHLARVHCDTVSGNSRVAALLDRLGFVRARRTPGPAWMTERGWTHQQWELSAEDWRGSQPHAGDPAGGNR